MVTAAVLGVVLVFLSFFVILYLLPMGVYIKCWSANVPAGAITLVAMNLRNVPTADLVDTYVKANKAGCEIELDRLEAHFLSGGNIDNVVNALIAASRANIKLSFPQAAAIDLAGRDVLGAVRMQVNPHVIATGDVCGVAKNGIEVMAKAKVTVRANLATMVGGAGEETILARIGQGIVTTIGSSETHTDVLKKPELITKKIMETGLDSGTAFEIVSLDIFDVSVGRNIGATLQTDQAEADKKVAQAKAEGRRALAEASIQENKANEQEARARVVEAEMRVPHSLASCFRKGTLFAQRRKIGSGNPGHNGTPPVIPPPAPPDKDDSGNCPSTVLPKLGFGADLG